MPADRVVRFTEQFFARLELLLPEERGADGTPSITDFLVFDLPAVHAILTRDVEAATLPSDEPDIRVYIGFGAMVSAFAIHVRVAGDGAVEAFWLALDSTPW
jgi:hypothetical protein